MRFNFKSLFRKAENTVGYWMEKAELLESQLQEQRETHALQLAAISTASLCNTRESHEASRIGNDHPFWTCAYGDVFQTVEREICFRELVDKREIELCAVEKELRELKGGQE
jgi:hypothetical protein